MYVKTPPPEELWSLIGSACGILICRHVYVCACVLRTLVHCHCPLSFLLVIVFLHARVAKTTRTLLSMPTQFHDPEMQGLWRLQFVFAPVRGRVHALQQRPGGVLVPQPFEETVSLLHGRFARGGLGRGGVSASIARWHLRLGVCDVGDSQLGRARRKPLVCNERNVGAALGCRLHARALQTKPLVAGAHALRKRAAHQQRRFGRRRGEAVFDSHAAARFETDRGTGRSRRQQQQQQRSWCHQWTSVPQRWF